jgi:thiosulfate dehydrogenase
MSSKFWGVVGVVLLTSACAAPPAPPKPDSAVVAPAVPAAFRVPADSEIPSGPLGQSIRRGRAMLAATRDSLPANVGNDLRCLSCHLDAGTRPGASPWVGVYSRFPQYRSRGARVITIQDRVNGCFQRSMNGKPLPVDGRDMTDIVAYLAFLSRGVAPPGDVPGQGFRKVGPLPGDSARGHLVFVGQCARCHGANGEGLPNPDPTAEPARYPPLWGPRSFNIGAGMARLRTAASFIRDNMPFDRPGTLTDQEAYDVATYLVSRPRPDFAGKENDWPRGDAPPDAAYPTKAQKARQTH